MEHTKFDAAIDVVLSRVPNFDRAAYHFLREALDFTLKDRKKSTGQTGHVTGQQLLDGIRRYAIKQYGPMVTSVLGYWGIHRTEDFGTMVFALVDIGVFGKTEQDSIADFRDVFSFEEAFVTPYLPETTTTAKPRLSIVDSPAAELN